MMRLFRKSTRLPAFSWAHRWRIYSLWLCFLAGLLVTPSQARVVGLVFDDSGSMGGILNRAKFATQLLVAALNEGDQLYVVRLNGGNAQVNGPITLANRQAFIAEITQWNAKGDTSYEPLDAMLAKIVAATPPNEEASLLVITDGGFNGSVASPEALNQRYSQLKNDFKGKNLAAHFVLLAAASTEQERQKNRDHVEQQGIRSKLLEVFNGNAQVGKVDIDQARNVFPELRNAITQLYGTDTSRTSTVINLQSSRIHLKPPFSISRLIVAAADEKGRTPAQFRSASFSLKQTPLLLQPKVGSYKANVYHLQPAQALQPGAEYVLEFDQALPPETQVLFDSGLDLKLRFFSNGQPLTPDSRGRLVIARNTSLEVRATLQDLLNSQNQQVDFSNLPQDPAFTLHQGNQSQSMALNKPQNYASVQLAYPNPGVYALTVEARYPGFVIRRAQDILIEVQKELPIQLSLQAERRDGCTTCKPDEGRATVITQPSYRDVFAVAVQADNVPEAGPYRLELAEPLPAGVRVLLPDGHSELSGVNVAVDNLTLQPGHKVTVLLQYNNAYRGQAAHTVHFRVTPVRPYWQGKGELALTLQPQIPQLTFKEAGHTGPDPARPFQLPLTELGKDQGIFIAAEQLLRDLDLGYVTVSSPTLNVAARLEAPDKLRIIPGKNWWCDCLTTPGNHAFTLEYRDPKTQQSARFTGQITLLDVPWWEKCWQEILLLLLVLITLFKIICILRTERFPSHSRLVVMRGKQIQKRIRLHSIWTIVWSCRDERRRTEGLELHATPNGAKIIFNRNLSQTLYYEATGDRLVQVFEDSQQRPVAWNWEDVLRDDQAGMSYVLKKTV